MDYQGTKQLGYLPHGFETVDLIETEYHLGEMLAP